LRNDVRALREAETRDDTFLSINTSDPLDKAPFILVLLQKADSLTNADGKLVIHGWVK